jgi:hypothetical protein
MHVLVQYTYIWYEPQIELYKNMQQKYIEVCIYACNQLYFTQKTVLFIK